MKQCVKFFLATVLLMLPLTGYTMSYNLGYVEGVERQQQITLQTETMALSAFVSESEADLFKDNIASGGVFATSQNDDKLSMADAPNLEKGDCMASNGCYKNPEVGWRGSL